MDANPLRNLSSHLSTRYSYQATEKEERQLILKSYRELVSILNAQFINAEQKKTFHKAFKIAADAHKTMRRKSGEPYILHPIAVTRIVIKEMNLGPSFAIVAILHDVVEDSPLRVEDIAHMFGKETADLVAGLTKLKRLSNPKLSLQAENIRKILLSIVKDPKVILIKLADRLHNMRTLHSMQPEKRIEIAGETIQIYVPIAHRLGLYAIKTELEDLSMRYLESGAYNEITTLLNTTQKDCNKLIQQFIRKIKKIFAEHSFTFPYQIIGRTKSIYSIWKKMQHKQVPLEEIFDIFAIRIILDVPEAQEVEKCFEVFSLIGKYYYTLKDRVRDWITQPKANGYAALHTTVLDKNGKWIEIQIRSKRMDLIAENGIAAHFLYKDQTGRDAHLNIYDEWMGRIRELLAHPQAEEKWEDMLHYFFHSLIVDEIFIFTPKGEVKKLPKNASVLDFAYAVHTKLGEQCIGAKINRRAVSIDAPLQSGERVEILTSHKQRPQEQHLSFLVSPKARKAVMSFIKAERKRLAYKGMKQFFIYLKEHNIERKKKYRQILMKKFRLAKLEDWFIQIAQNKIDLSVIKEDFFATPHIPILATQNPLFDIPAEDANKSISYNIAPCCQPICGDKVCGIVNKNVNPEIIQVHTLSCDNATRMCASYDCQVISLQWNDAQQLLFAMYLSIKGIDRKGILYDTTKLISHELDIDIARLYVDINRDKAATFQMNVKVFVRNKEQWTTLVHRLKNIDGILSVERSLYKTPLLTMDSPLPS